MPAAADQDLSRSGVADLFDIFDARDAEDTIATLDRKCDQILSGLASLLGADDSVPLPPQKCREELQASAQTEEVAILPPAEIHRTSM